MKNNLEDKNILSQEIIDVMDIILHVYPNIVFGGSICLNALNLINRKIEDIDIFISEDDELDEEKRILFRLFKKNDSGFEVGSDTITDMNGKEIKRTSYKYKNVKICCFTVSKEELQCNRFNFSGRSINIQNANYAIAAKRIYADKNEKHAMDLQEIDKYLSNESEYESKSKSDSKYPTYMYNDKLRMIFKFSNDGDKMYRKLNTYNDCDIRFSYDNLINFGFKESNLNHILDKFSYYNTLDENDILKTLL